MQTGRLEHDMLCYIALLCIFIRKCHFPHLHFMEISDNYESRLLFSIRIEGYDHDHMLTWKMFFQRLKLLLLFWQKERVTDTDRCLTNDLPSLLWCRRRRVPHTAAAALLTVHSGARVCVSAPKKLVHCAARRRRRRRTRSIFASNKHKITIFL